MKRLIALALCSACLGSIPASAHHSLAANNRSTYKTVEGTVKTFEWTNPHAKLSVVVPGPGGTVTQWDFEGGSIGRLMGGGFKRDAVAPGDKVTVAYNPKRDGAVGGFFLAVTTADGTTYALDRFNRFKGVAPGEER